MAIIINNCNGSKVDVNEDDNGNVIVSIKNKDASPIFCRSDFYVGDPVEFKYMVVGKEYFRCLDDGAGEPNNEAVTVDAIHDEVKKSWSNLSNPNSHESKTLNKAVKVRRR